MPRKKKKKEKERPMSDAGPNYNVSMQTLRTQIFSLESTKERQVLEVMEIDARREGLVENIIASNEQIEVRQTKLASLIEEHGEPRLPDLTLRKEVSDG